MTKSDPPKRDSIEYYKKEVWCKCFQFAETELCKSSH